MPADSKRKAAIVALRDLIATVNGPSATYFKNLTGEDQVTSLLMTPDLRAAEGYHEYVYVFDGTELLLAEEVTGKNIESTLELIIVCVAISDTDAPMVEELNDLIHDVQLVVGTDTSLGGLVSGLRIVSIEAPVYSTQEREGTAVIHAECTLDYVSGITV